MTTFKEAQRIRSKPVARSKRVHKVPTEDQEQITLVSWAHHVKYGNGRLSDYLIHIPNGGSRNIIEAAKFKKMGDVQAFTDPVGALKAPKEEERRITTCPPELMAQMKGINKNSKAGRA